MTERTKRATTMNYDTDILDAFMSTGADWQARMNDALREWLATHSHA
ncbi:conserved hypothetical protein [Gammaproteobacteria bacterium]